MSQDALDHNEREALRAGIDAAGPYLDEIGETDLKRLNGAQTDEFLRRLYLAFEDNLRERLSNHAAPF